MIKLENIEGLGTKWYFDLFDADEKNKEEITSYITKKITTFEQNYSRFLETSIVGTLNKRRKLSHPPTQFINLLNIGVDLYKDTDGIFNFLSGHLQVEQGYGNKTTLNEDIDLERTADPTKDILITNDEIVLNHGAVDFGGFGKGYLIDSLVKNLKETFNMHHFIINGGGDIYIATETDKSPEYIYVEHPTKENHYIAKIPLSNEAFASSGTNKRKWTKNGENKNHILSEHNANVSINIIEKNAITADIIATVICATNEEKAIEILKNKNIEYIYFYEENIHMSSYFEKHLI